MNVTQKSSRRNATCAARRALTLRGTPVRPLRQQHTAAYCIAVRLCYTYSAVYNLIRRQGASRTPVPPACPARYVQEHWNRSGSRPALSRKQKPNPNGNPNPSREVTGSPWTPMPHAHSHPGAMAQHLGHDLHHRHHGIANPRLQP